MSQKFIDDDFVRVRRAPESKAPDAGTAFYGDPIEILDGAPTGWTKVKFLNGAREWAEGYVKGPFATQDTSTVLKFSMVDVQQGDGMVIETPEGKVILIDGGDNKLFARHLASRFRYRATTDTNRMDVDAIIVTHGDADHFEGLSLLKESERDTRKRKALHIFPKRVFHNGLLKGPSSIGGQRVRDEEIFGETGKLVDMDGTGIVDLHDNFIDAPAAKLNLPFRTWQKTLQYWQQKRGQAIEMQRLRHNMPGPDPFAFLQPEGIEVEVLGPFEVQAFHPETMDIVPALPFFHQPRKSAEISLFAGDAGRGAISASHTINGHSIALRLQYGNIRFLLTGDMNQESLALAADKLGPQALESEILKAPHHGSADFSLKAIQAANPVVALVSSGDESVAKEFIHPRATLMSALGQCMQGDIGLVFSTELTAFFAYQEEVIRKQDILEYLQLQGDRSYTVAELKQLFKEATPRPRKNLKKEGYGTLNSFQGFERLNFGIVHIRTNGDRVLVFTNSAEFGTYEAYAFTVTRDADGRRVVKFAKDVKTSG